MAKIRHFDSFGGCIPHFCPGNIYRDTVTPAGQKNILGPLSKNNISMDAIIMHANVLYSVSKENWSHNIS